VLMAKMQSSKFEVEKFSGKNNFELWKLKMRDLLVQQGLQKALAGKLKKPTAMTNGNGRIWMRKLLAPFVYVWRMRFCLIS
jgi:hypothetical protein